ncbi:putative RFC2-DNA replication factor C, 41 kd subunit [Tilletiaria anomala UBC 951]|uniref:Replication factor C subunit 2 n=1 Tax=Tilletiaria anomala (strain ATCC 24038 / CBS 436.72 / UBC 951) TaxID=1037660 RepID=A0A066W8P9_TILAU|nr:putative RFC2-DNA replication factor C, 41 kd subunit [Tilletiaria anomala UBC 951]KDN48893.1 putative RFC2-DNA replication factor C, 41 kd subunit [Tilletiaria anomala UBC 951]
MFLQQQGRKAAGGKGKEPGEAAALKPWVEKYRPKTIDDVAAQEHTVSVLRKTLLSTNLPHMLFYGPPGTGKTSTILALARQLFGPELMKTRVLELNASDERGISVVREKIKNFAKLSVTQPKSGYPCPPYKIIILDEADSMTQDAQSALRRIMEQYSRITRFCLVCNYVTRIIEPLASRCSKFRFRMLSTSSTKERLHMIAREEKVEFDSDDVLDMLISTSDGDLRRAITYLQSASRLHNSDAVTQRSIVEIAGVVPAQVIVSLGRAVGVSPPPGADGDEEMDHIMEEADEVPKAGIGNSSRFNVIKKQVEHIAQEGYSGTQVLIQLHDYLILHPTIPARAKAKCSLHLGDTDKAFIDGGDEELHLLNLCLKLAADLA